LVLNCSLGYAINKAHKNSEELELHSLSLVILFSDDVNSVYGD